MHHQQDQKQKHSIYRRHHLLNAYNAMLAVLLACQRNLSRSPGEAKEQPLTEACAHYKCFAAGKECAERCCAQSKSNTKAAFLSSGLKACQVRFVTRASVFREPNALVTVLGHIGR